VCGCTNGGATHLPRCVWSCVSNVELSLFERPAQSWAVVAGVWLKPVCWCACLLGAVPAGASCGYESRLVHQHSCLSVWGVCMCACLVSPCVVSPCVCHETGLTAAATAPVSVPVKAYVAPCTLSLHHARPGAACCCVCALLLCRVLHVCAVALRPCLLPCRLAAVCRTSLRSAVPSTGCRL
jgi:hypothetical protein